MGEVGGLEGAAEDGDGVVLCGDIVEGFRATEALMLARSLGYWSFGNGVRTISPPMAVTGCLVLVQMIWMSLLVPQPQQQLVVL